MTDETVNPQMRDIHFLVVDDDIAARTTIAEYLSTLQPGKITTAVNGADAYRLLEKDKTINFIISDWEMPILNGLSLLQKIRAKKETANLPFLICTSPISAEQEKIILAAENMVDQYIIKPFRMAVLKEKIESILKLSIHGPRKQAVVVDDDNDARETIAEYLQQFGFRNIATFSEGKLALQHLRNHHDDVGIIVSDWEMKEVSGIDLLKQCKSDDRLKDIPFLMITSQSSIENLKIVEAAKANVDQYLLKPFRSSEFKARIDEMLEKGAHKSKIQVLIKDGFNHLRQGAYNRAQEAFEQILKLDPANDTALRELGDLLIKSKGIEVALPMYKSALEANPFNFKNYIHLSSAYQQLGWIDKAIALIISAQENIGQNAELHFHLGQLYMKKGMREQARSEFERTIEIKLDHQEARLMLNMMGGDEQKKRKRAK